MFQVKGEEPEGAPCAPVGPREPQGAAQESRVVTPQSPILIDTVRSVLSGVPGFSIVAMGWSFHCIRVLPGWMVVSGYTPGRAGLRCGRVGARTSSIVKYS